VFLALTRRRSGLSNFGENIMTSKSTEDHARNFLRYGMSFDNIDFQEVAEWETRPVESVYVDFIVGVMESYINDATFAYNIPNVKNTDCSQLYKVISDEIGDLSNETLRVLAMVMMAKTKAN
jgi:hypothetical protein